MICADCGANALEWSLNAERRPVCRPSCPLPLEGERVSEQPKLKEGAAAASPEVRPLQGAKPIDELLPAAVATMAARARGEAKPLPLPDGWGALSETLGGGLWPGLTVLVGSTGTGKSQFALQVALNAARHRTPVLYVGLELDETQLVARLAAMALREQGVKGLSWSKLWRGAGVSVDELERGAGLLRGLPFYFDMAEAFGGWSFESIAIQAGALKEQHPDAPSPPLVVVDYLQLVGNPTDADGRMINLDTRERIMRASYAAREAARKHGAAVLLLSSTARENYSKLAVKESPWTGDAAELVGLGKEAGEVEYSADNVLVMARGEHQENGTPVYIGAAKVRAGTSSKGGAWPRFTFDGLVFKPDRAPSQQHKRAPGE